MLDYLRLHVVVDFGEVGHIPCMVERHCQILIAKFLLYNSVWHFVIDRIADSLTGRSCFRYQLTLNQFSSHFRNEINNGNHLMQ